MVSIYDPLGIRSPYRILGKVIYSELCEEKIPDILLDILLEIYLISY